MIAIEQLQLQIAQLGAELEANSPGYKNYLKEIHQSLLKAPEMVHLLKTDGELSVVIDAMKKFKQIEIPITKVKDTSGIRGPVSLDQF